MLQENNFFRCSILPIVQPQQWGNTRGGTTVTFPVSFTTLFSLSAVQQYAGYLAQGAAVNNWSSSKFTANSSSENGHGNQYIFWIAIGK